MPSATSGCGSPARPVGSAYNEIDLVIGSFRNIPNRIRRQRLCTDGYVCIASRGNTHLGKRGSRSRSTPTYQRRTSW
jgi:hypothetical protein